MVIGYRDMSSTKPDASYLYSPDESLLQIEISAKMAFREPCASFIRTRPLKSMDDSTVSAVLDSGKKIEIPFDGVRAVGALISVPHGVMENLLNQRGEWTKHFILGMVKLRNAKS